jgi:hypothetical protein
MALATNKLSMEQNTTSFLGGVEPKVEHVGEKQEIYVQSSSAPLKDLARAEVSHPVIDNELNSENKGTPVSENQFFKTVQNVLSPAINELNKGYRPVIISSIGAALHFLDSFVESSNLPPVMKKLSYNA